MAFKSVAAGKDKPEAKPKPRRAVAAPVDDGGEKEAVEEGVEEHEEAKEAKNQYEILEAGTIIGATHFPNEDAKKGEEMLIKLTHSEAQRHQMRGIRLRRVE